MGRIIDVDEVQGELDRAAHDAKHGPADVRAGRFVHRDAKGGRFAIGKEERTMRSSDGRRIRKEKRAQQNRMGGPKFCSKKITEDVRDSAATLNEAQAGLDPHPEAARSAVSKDEAEAGMREMIAKFRAMGEQVYVSADAVKESNRSL